MNRTIRTIGRRRLSAALLCGAIASSFAAVPAAKAENFDAREVKVTFSDLDVTHAQGAATLYRRIKAAAETVCSPYWATGFAARVDAYDCVHSAIADAVTTVDQPALSQVYAAKNRTPLPMRSASLR